MSIRTESQLENTRAKLEILEKRLLDLGGEPVANVRTRELTKQSLEKIANQMKEEIVRFEARRMSASA